MLMNKGLATQFMDAIHYKVREDKQIVVKAAYVVLGVIWMVGKMYLEYGLVQMRVVNSGYQY